jgi:hypothetical protein
MSGASIEMTLERGAHSLLDGKARTRSVFSRERVAASANLLHDRAYLEPAEFEDGASGACWLKRNK